MLIFGMIFWACSQKEPDTTDSAEEADTAGASEASAENSEEPSSDPSSSPTSEPSSSPTSDPTSEPSSSPTSEPTSEPLELVGSYIDNVGSEHVISEGLWMIDYGSNEQYYYHIAQYSNQDDYLVAENDSANGPPEAGAWSRFDWVYKPDDSLWVCQTLNTASSQQEALVAQAPDVNVAGSCAPYGWMRLY